MGAERAYFGDFWGLLHAILNEMKATHFLSSDEIKHFTKLSNLRGLQALATTWLMIAACFVLVTLFPNPLTIAVAMVILGGRQLALAILMHDCSHYSLFKTRSWNDFLGAWFCGYPVWLDLRRYREHHWRHHRLAGTREDPDDALVSNYPVSRSSFIRKALRDLSGLSGIKRIYGLILMDLGFIEFTVSSTVKKVDQTGRTAVDVVRAGFQNLGPVILTQGVFFGVLLFFGEPLLYLLWVASYLTTFSLILRIRSIAEHALTDYDPDPRKCTRTTYASPLARVTVAPHRVNYHLEHHVLMMVPYFRLKEMHEVLLARDAYGDAHVSQNYREVMKLAIK